MPLRYFQRDAKDAVEMAFSAGLKRVCIQMPTGSGKTVTAAHLIGDRLPERSLFLADQDELVTQPRAVIRDNLNIIAAIERAKDKASLQAKIVIGSSQTLIRKPRRERFPSDFFHQIIIDEYHRGTERDTTITGQWPDADVLGITATPYWPGGKDLTAFYDAIVYRLPLLDFVKIGFAPPIKVVTVPVEVDLAEVKSKAGDLDESQLDRAIDPYLEEIIKKLVEIASERHMIVFLPLIATSKRFAELAMSAGIACRHIDGKSEDRHEAIERFKLGQYQWLANAGVLDTGVDIPIVDAICNLRPTKSLARFQQEVGRGTRVLPGLIDDLTEEDQAEERRGRIAASAKPNCLLIDFLWESDKLKLIGPECLIAEDAADAKLIAAKLRRNYTEEQLAAIAEAVRKEKEAKLIAQLEQATQKQREMGWQEFFYLIKRQDLYAWRPNGRSDHTPPTMEQLAKLQQWHFRTSDITSKTLASLIIGQVLWRFRYHLATPWQLAVLSRRNIPHDVISLSKKQASVLIEKACKK